MDIFDILYKIAVFALFLACVLMFLFVMLMEYKWKLMDRIDKEKRKEFIRPFRFAEKQLRPDIYLPYQVIVNSYNDLPMRPQDNRNYLVQDENKIYKFEDGSWIIDPFNPFNLREQKS